MKLAYYPHWDTQYLYYHIDDKWYSIFSNNWFYENDSIVEGWVQL